MENEQFEKLPDMTTDRMNIKKVFMILGLGLSLSVIFLNTVQYVTVEFFLNYFPQIAKTDIFPFAINTVPLLLIAMPILYAVMNIIPSTKTTYKSKISFSNFTKIFVISYAIMLGLNLVTLAINGIISGITGIIPKNQLAELLGDGNIWVTILFVVILSPIVEEIMFRHIIIEKLRQYGSGVAIFASAFAFSLYHGNLFQIIYAFGVGVIFGAIVYKTGKVRYAIILHMLLNFVGSVFPYGMMSQNIWIAMLCVLILIGTILSGIILGVITLCKTDFSKFKRELMPRQYIKPFFLNIGMLVYILLMVTMIVLAFVR